jgi:hypothetical protein
MVSLIRVWVLFLSKILLLLSSSSPQSIKQASKAKQSKALNKVPFIHELNAAEFALYIL